MNYVEKAEETLVLATALANAQGDSKSLSEISQVWIQLAEAKFDHRV